MYYSLLYSECRMHSMVPRMCCLKMSLVTPECHLMQLDPVLSSLSDSLHTPNNFLSIAITTAYLKMESKEEHKDDNRVSHHASLEERYVIHLVKKVYSLLRPSFPTLTLDELKQLPTSHLKGRKGKNTAIS